VHSPAADGQSWRRCGHNRSATGLALRL